jgi:hydrogenase expression/formation protein HypE
MTASFHSAFSLTCPVAQATGERILLAHGEGARLTRRLIHEEIVPALGNEFLRVLSDGAVLPSVEGRLAVTTDGSVVAPLFFPGGDIGKLAIYGAVNDLAVCGAEPLYVTLGLIIEEGLPIEVLRRVLSSVGEAARCCHVLVVTGDTKVVPRGAADQLFLHTTGIGRLRPGIDLGPHRIAPRDCILVSGTIGDHGLAILAAREGLDSETTLVSDSAPLHELCNSLLSSGADIHFLRDPTRGGVSAVLHEVAEAAGVSVTLEEGALPISPAVRGASEILGLDPLYVANEGKLLAIVAADDTAKALACLRAQPLGARAAQIGSVCEGTKGEVTVRGMLGELRVLDEPSGAPLPRIC